jgi:hypothetical protein
MSGNLVQVPSFEFSAFYYPQLLEALMVYKRINVPELTDESNEEPSVQFMRAFALVGHLNNVLIDIVANESTLPTAQLPETIRNMLRLIDYELSPATPGATDLIYRLGKVFNASFQLVPNGAQASTQRDSNGQVIYFEALTGVLIQRTDQLGACFVENPAGVFTARTTEANAGTAFVATTPAGCALYIAHDSIMWDKMNFVVSAVSPATIGVWEYYDGDPSDTRPTDVTNIGGGQLKFDLTGLLGASNRAGAIVRVRLNTTTAFEDVISTWDGTKNVATTSLLGQSSPSLLESDYTVGSNWQEIAGMTDGTALLDQTGDVSFALPQSVTQNWKETTVNGFTGFFLRFRVVTSAVGAGPTLGRIRIDVGKQYATALVYQGRTVTAETLGSSNGTPNQRFATAQTDFILNSQSVRVDGETWVKVDDFLESGPGAKVYRIELTDNDVAQIIFGDGVTGLIPPIGQGNVVIDYRFGAADNGNVGSNTITVDKQGLTFVEAIYNPRTATGWSEAEAASQESLAKAKLAGPASLRTKEVAVTPDDLVTLAMAYKDSGGSKPVGRARPIEESFGPKTVELICVGTGGVLISNTQLDALTTYFNGDENAIPPIPKRFIANQEVTCTNFSPHPIDVTATVYAPDDVIAQQVINQLTAVLQPESLKEDGTTYTWEFGADVPLSRINHEIFRTDARISKVLITSPAADVPLGTRELPTAGTFSITMVATN